MYGNPKIGTASMQKAPTVAIDVPLKALVWEDDQGKAWLTYNSGEYIQDYVYPRNGELRPIWMPRRQLAVCWLISLRRQLIRGPMVRTI